MDPAWSQTLQWGRNLSVAEGPESPPLIREIQRLQWGRNLSVAEGSRPAENGAAHPASMGPQPFGCGRHVPYSHVSAARPKLQTAVHFEPHTLQSRSHCPYAPPSALYVFASALSVGPIHRAARNSAVPPHASASAQLKRGPYSPRRSQRLLPCPPRRSHDERRAPPEYSADAAEAAERRAAHTMNAGLLPPPDSIGVPIASMRPSEPSPYDGPTLTISTRSSA